MDYAVTWVVELEQGDCLTHYKNFGNKENALENAIAYAKDQILSTVGCIMAEVSIVLVTF